MSKGSKRRPRQISRAQDELNWALYCHKITFEQWEKKTAKLKDKEDGRKRRPN